MNNKIVYPTLKDNVVTIIRNKIIKGELLPGSRIIESEIAKDLEISRGPIREALRQIEHEGLIEYKSNKGCTVRTIDAKEVEDIYLIRAHLEMLAVDICDGEYKKETIQEMDSLLEEMESSSKERDIFRLVELDELFHTKIIKESGNERLYDVWSTFWSANVVIFTSTYNLKLAESKDQRPAHERILNTIKTGDKEEIKNSIKRHYIRSANPFNSI
ncbi:GntR family transcriptional regulator [Bacillus sp. FJAT-29937]|uniref:GntR family transcriptional regulator n=1 Tax=Bacillus sp. FJAT-29937 TaxID=1720553 RepID=UPI00083330EB|nr:GntR family transcriptional regulator [Bacillus sp. FJAT-29937]